MKKKLIITIIFVIIVIGVIFGIFLKNKGETHDENTIPNNYIAIFHGEVGLIKYETYIYKIDNGQANYGFKYVNVKNIAEPHGSSNWIPKITDKGEFDWTDGAFIIAKKNQAYSYVTVPKDNKKYTIEEFQVKFLMD